MDDKDMFAVDSKDIIGRATPVENVLAILARHGCIYVDALIDYSTCSGLPLAGGGFSDLYRGATYGGTPIAIKSLRVFDRLGQSAAKEKILKRTARQLYHWSKLNHPNVLPLMGAAIFRGHMSMVSEWMDNGSLMSYISANPNVDRSSLCLDVCTGLSFIHANGMVHGNLKAANILVSRSGTALISDFGSSQLKDLTLQFTNTTNASFSLRWAAPELFADDGPSHVSQAAEVYAFGMTMLEILTGKVPYDGLNEQQAIIMVVVRRKTPARPSVGVSDEMWGMLNSCWAWEHSKRPTIADLEERLLGLSTNPAVTQSGPGHPEYPGSLGLESTAAEGRVYGQEGCDSVSEDITECIGRTTTLKDVIGALVEQGCQDLTSNIALATCTEFPLDGGGFCDVYQGITSDGSKLAIKTLRIFQQPGKDNDGEKIIKASLIDYNYIATTG